MSRNLRGRVAQLAQSACFTSNRSLVRFQPRPLPIEVRLRLRRSHDDFDRFACCRHAVVSRARACRSRRRWPNAANGRGSPSPGENRVSFRPLAAKSLAAHAARSSRLLLEGRPSRRGDPAHRRPAVLSAEEWRRIVSVNLIGVFHACSQVLPHMKRAGGVAS